MNRKMIAVVFGTLVGAIAAALMVVAQAIGRNQAP